ncbi:LPP20 family lipoprotein [Psychromonas hadalis]|uniref:LPP20 family lipoprotein n=1 Tax=Psychromonas hadalis TaxID=211669 RepID=UPI0003B7560A|nr:LPP20 family lipoprotein [Psychromonas hadalis]
MKLYPFILFALPFLSACSNITEVPIYKAEHVFTSVGYAPIEAQSGDSFDLKMLNAIKASKLEAYKEMAEQIYGVLLTADNSTDGAVLQNDRIKAKVEGVVRGAHVLRSYNEGDVYITELELDMQTLPLLKDTEFEPSQGALIKVQETVYY